MGEYEMPGAVCVCVCVPKLVPPPALKKDCIFGWMQRNEILTSFLTGLNALVTCKGHDEGFHSNITTQNERALPQPGYQRGSISSQSGQRGAGFKRTQKECDWNTN